MKRILLASWAVLVILTTGADSQALISRPVTSQTEGSISLIRNRYSAVNRNVRKYRKVRKELSGFSLEGGELVAYLHGPQIMKITAAYFGETGKATEDYYYWNDKLIFVLRQDYRYHKPMSGKVTRTQSNRFYFENARLIRWIDENRTARSAGDGEYGAKQQELLETSDKFLKAARSPEPVIEAN